MRYTNWIDGLDGPRKALLRWARRAFVVYGAFAIGEIVYLLDVIPTWGSTCWASSWVSLCYAGEVWLHAAVYPTYVFAIAFATWAALQAARIAHARTGGSRV